MKKIFDNLTQWQNYVHYLLLTLTIMLLTDLDGLGVGTKLYFILFLADTAIHFVFSILPGKLKWKD